MIKKTNRLEICQEREEMLRYFKKLSVYSCQIGNKRYVDVGVVGMDGQ